jgi:transposase
MHLTTEQHAAASLIGAGRIYQEVADEIGVHIGTIKRWMQRQDFREAVQRAKHVANGTPDSPVDVLRAALVARKDDGVDWTNRVKASLALIELEGNSPTPVTTLDEILEDEMNS